MGKRTFIVIVSFLALLSNCLTVNAEYNAADKVKVAVMPFNDTATMAPDMKIPLLLNAELSSKDFIETIPPRMIKDTVLSLEPSLLWTDKSEKKETSEEKNNKKEVNKNSKTGAVLWKIGPEISYKAARQTGADFVVYGDISRFNKKWIITVSISDSDGKSLKTFNISADKEDELPAKVRSLSNDIAAFIRRDTAVPEAEEIVRKYMGHMYSLSLAISRIERLAKAQNDSIPLQALLLDLYLRDKKTYKPKISHTASKIVSLYDPANEAGTRYLLSLSLDPFDVLAAVHEENKEWAKALEYREKAMDEFPFFGARHRPNIGKDAYELAAISEQKKQHAKSIEYYKKALPYLNPGSTEFKQAKEKIAETKRNE